MGIVSLHAQNIGISNDAAFTTPQSPLHIYWTADGNLLQLSRSSAANTGLTFSVSSNDYSILNRQNNALIFGTNATECMRIFSSGAVRIGYGTAATDALQVGGYGTTNPTVFIGAEGGAPGYGRIGLYGTSYGTFSTILRGGGLSYFNSGNQYVFGQTTAVDANDFVGIVGNATYPWALNAYTDQANAGAVFGANTAATGAGTGAGVYGISLQTGAAGVVGDGSSNTRGVLGINNNDTYAAVQAQNANANGDALLAYNTAANGSGTGTAIWAYSRQTGASTIVAGLQSWSYFANASISAFTDANISNGKGIIGACDNATGVGVQGQSAGSTGIGVVGVSSSATGFGGYFQNTNNSGTGIIGSGNNLSPSYNSSGSGGAFTGKPWGIAVYKYGALANGEGAGLFIASSTSNVGVYVAYRNGVTNYKILNVGAFGGSASTDVWGLTNDTNDRKIMFCPEAPEILFQDYGQGELINGRAHIELDPIFSRNIVINDEHPLRVFIQLEGDCNGVYVTKKTKNGFDVIELQNGKSNVKFTWFVTANRADYINPITNELISKHEGVRFPQAPNPEKIERLPERKYGGLCIPQAPKSEKIESLRVRNYENEKLKKVEK
jgi:hypothetical protein